MIRPATSVDIPFMIELERACTTAGHWTEERYHQMFQVGTDAAQRFVLVEDGSTEKRSNTSEETSFKASCGVLGFLVARHLAPEWELENIVVAPASRRTGLGKRLLDALLTRARETKSEAVFLEVRESNTAARSLYEKGGFEPSGRRKAYYTDPLEDAVLYRRSLGLNCSHSETAPLFGY